MNENVPMWRKNKTICEQRKQHGRGKKCLFCMVDEQGDERGRGGRRGTRVRTDITNSASSGDVSPWFECLSQMRHCPRLSKRCNCTFWLIASRRLPFYWEAAPILGNSNLSYERWKLNEPRTGVNSGQLHYYRAYLNKNRNWRFEIFQSITIYQFSQVGT